VKSAKQLLADQQKQLNQLLQENERLTKENHLLRQQLQREPRVPQQTIAKNLPELATSDNKEVLKQLVTANQNAPFSQEQLAAITFPMKTHLRIIAGAGSGKTQTICAKAAYLVLQENVAPRTIMMCTFSKKARNEMDERVASYLNNQGHIPVKTFHSWFGSEYLMLVKRFPELCEIGITGEINESKYQQVLNRLIGRFRLYNFNKHEERSIAERLSYWTNLGYSEQQMIAFVKKYFDQENLLPGHLLSEVFAEFLTALNKAKRAEHFITFDDMMVNLKLILENNDQVLQVVQSKYRYIFIDEFQDINPLQKQIVELICPPDINSDEESPCKLIIVGDDDQSIYYFRGAEPQYIKDFDKEYQQTSLKLMTNYRSNAPIVKAGNLLIAHNAHDRLTKKMLAKNTDTTKDCQVLSFASEESESSWIAKRVLALSHLTPASKYTDTLILYPTRLQLRSLIKTFEEKNVPYVTQPNSDLLGVFGLPMFSGLFKKMLALAEATEKASKKVLFSEIVQQYSFYHYVSFGVSSSYANTIFNQKKGVAAKDIMEWLVKEKQLSPAAAQHTRNFFNQIIHLYLKGELTPKPLVDALVQTPKFKNDLAPEELTWLTKELVKKKDWPTLQQAYAHATNRIAEMRERLKAYENHEFDAVYLLTIHASKGLGAKNVFVKGIYGNSLPDHRAKTKQALPVQKLKEQANPATTLEEQRRLLYVAMTRAKENLYLTYPRTINDKKTTPSLFLEEAGFKPLHVK
jgi:DNA helicase-2/ATP-dependent DNA helicase PcrA